MTISLRFYQDAGLTVPLSRLRATQPDSGGSSNDYRVYLGSTAVGKQFQAISDPGVDAIMLSVLDSAPASGVATSAVKLALSQGGLDTAEAGAPLAVGATLLSSAAESLAVHLRVTAPALAAGLYADLSLALSPLIEDDQGAGL